MSPHPLGEDTAYTIHPLREVAWPLGWGRARTERRGAPWAALSLIAREYLLSTLLLGLVACAFTARVAMENAWAARHHLAWRVNVVLKRTFDISAALIGVILAAPVFLVLPILIKLDSPGPVFFRQVRVGLNRRRGNRRRLGAQPAAECRRTDRRKQNVYGRPFDIIKFRSMVHDAEKRCGPVWAISNDPRITRVGAFMRRTRLDELPQLINVLKGEMSLVGPRPERPFFIEKLAQEVPGFLDRLRVAPGITGLAQVRNGYDASVDHVRQKVHYDLSYIRDWNLLKDLKIILSTVVVVFTGRGAC